MSPFDLLDDALINHIFNYCSKKDRVSLSSVNKRFRKIITARPHTFIVDADLIFRIYFESTFVESISELINESPYHIDTLYIIGFSLEESRKKLQFTQRRKRHKLLKKKVKNFYLYNCDVTIKSLSYIMETLFPVKLNRLVLDSCNFQEKRIPCIFPSDLVRDVRICFSSDDEQRQEIFNRYRTLIGGLKLMFMLADCRSIGTIIETRLTSYLDHDVDPL